jgi:hypothetical protein
VEYPGDWCLRGSNEGTEPFETEEAFAGKSDWRTLDAAFLDQDREALSFFSDEAFRFYLPAYLLADLDGCLRDVDVVFHLCHGLQDDARRTWINPRRYGERTWFESACHKFATFDGPQLAAIIAYLRLKRERDEGWNKGVIDQALQNYWLPRAAS